MTTGDKLHKVLADAGKGSRREMERLISAGRVTVNGEQAHLGQRVQTSDEIRMDGGKPLRVQASQQRVLVMNKNDGLVCTRKDEEGRPTVFRDLPQLKHGRWIGVGRLDINTTGLLLLCSDGELANRLMHPSTGLDREYAVRVHGELSAESIKRLLAGVELDGEVHRFSDLRYFNGSGSNHWYHVVLLEGRNREVRRLFEVEGLRVSRLKRVRYGPVVLPPWLPRGQVASMSDADVQALYRLVGLRAEFKQRGRAKEERSMLLPYPSLAAKKVPIAPKT